MQRRVALVTGANRGIGFEIARQLADLGITVVIGSRDIEKGAAAAHSLESDHRSVQGHHYPGCHRQYHRQTRPHRHPSQQRRHHDRFRDHHPGTRPDDVSKYIGDQRPWAASAQPGLYPPHAREQLRAHRQYFKHVGISDGYNHTGLRLFRYFITSLSAFQDVAERVDRASCQGIAGNEYPGQFGLPGMGTHPIGR